MQGFPHQLAYSCSRYRITLYRSDGQVECDEAVYVASEGEDEEYQSDDSGDDSSESEEDSSSACTKVTVIKKQKWSSLGKSI